MGTALNLETDYSSSVILPFLEDGTFSHFFASCSVFSVNVL